MLKIYKDLFSDAKPINCVGLNNVLSMVGLSFQKLRNVAKYFFDRIYCFVSTQHENGKS